MISQINSFFHPRRYSSYPLLGLSALSGTFALILLVIGVFCPGCKKFLDEKPKQLLAIPKTVGDLQRMLDNQAVMNQKSPSGYAEMLADNFHFLNDYYQQYSNTNLNVLTKNYIWAADAPPLSLFWNEVYTGPVYYSNIILDQLLKIRNQPEDSLLVKEIKGSALFHRAFAFYTLAQLYCRPYAEEYLSSPGIVLRLTSDASIVTRQRSTVAETYDKIIADLKEASSLLPVSTSVPTRPSQTAAYAALARVYLSMRNYLDAGLYANMALSQINVLLDYNTRLPATTPAFAAFNPEIIFQYSASDPLSPLAFEPGVGIVDSALYQSYDSDDLRKVLFFRTSQSVPYLGTKFFFRGSYAPPPINSSYSTFNGLATDELYLIRSECAAREGNKDSAMADLNRLMINRWSNAVAYPVITAASATEAVANVLSERRKELMWRGLRWTDIRRLNLEGANIILTRDIMGTIYTLPPNDMRSVMLIPHEETSMSGIQQNPR